MTRPRLFVFAKAPVLGRAKTRLAKDIGFVHAKRLYRAMTGRILRNIQDPRWDIVLAVTPNSALNQVKDWHGYVQIPQARGDLSPRLGQVFASYNGPIVVIGTDSPQVNSQDISNAVQALKSHKAVFGPASDGGFWLMAMKGPMSPSIFDNVRWSSADTLSDLSKNISGKILKLRTLTDIDDLDALQKVRRDHSGII